jgi:tetratricopeptide (TPR) repeat protein
VLKQYILLFFPILFFACGRTSSYEGAVLPTQNAIATLASKKASLDALNDEISGIGYATESLYQRARINVELNKTDAALADIRRALAAEPTNSKYQWFLAVCLNAQQNYAEAYAQAKQAELLGYKEAKLYNLLASLELGQQHITQAKKYIDQSLLQAPFHGEIYHTLGNYYMATNDSAAAILAYEKAVAMKEKYKPSYLSLANLYNQMGQTDKALNLSISLAIQYPFDTENLNTLAKIYAKRNRADTAIFYYTQALKLKPNMYQASYDAGLISLKTKNYPSALAFFLNTKKYAPRTAQINTLLAICYENLGQTTTAYDHYVLATIANAIDGKAWQGRQRLEGVLYGTKTIETPNFSSKSPKVNKKDSVQAPIKIESIKPAQPRPLQRDTVFNRFKIKN